MEDALPVVRVLEPAIGRVPGQRLDLGRDVPDRRGLVVVADVGDRGNPLHQAAVALLRRAEGAVGASGLGQVAQIAGEDHLAADVRSRDGQLHGKLRAVGPHGVQLDAATEHRAATVLDLARERVAVSGPELRRDDQLRQLAPDRLLAPVSERPLRSRVEVEHPPAGIHRHDAVERRLEDRGVEGATPLGAQLPLAAIACRGHWFLSAGPAPA
jgi:hypothetical protein